ncbi:hypothetical protein MFUM_310021 [Methylacidiphilum fumariolicum SolV]|uniref:Uncharacterized protein n=2 Tax=Candidatus Methylacidiphilum fumarolicum TaxID=591154 RepID=I0JXY1_METFB|nr:conserved protein of unknown function [Candidatus Methylacidiphilum fumarolicum]CCG92100.1 hypothetical protein MFUM_310021 [Methylacidiphilum fumariolicum SolV]
MAPVKGKLVVGQAKTVMPTFLAVLRGLCTSCPKVLEGDF